MGWHFEDEIPIYLQIIDRIKLEIISGRLKANDRIATVRDLSAEAGVNPNTIQKALSIVEAEGLITTDRTMGKYVTDNVQAIEKAKKDYIHKRLSGVINELQNLGFSVDDIIELLKEHK